MQVADVLAAVPSLVWLAAQAVDASRTPWWDRPVNQSVAQLLSAVNVRMVLRRERHVQRLVDGRLDHALPSCFHVDHIDAATMLPGTTLFVAFSVTGASTPMLAFLDVASASDWTRARQSLRPVTMEPGLDEHQAQYGVRKFLVAHMLGVVAGDDIYLAVLWRNQPWTPGLGIRLSGIARDQNGVFSRQFTPVACHLALPTLRSTQSLSMQPGTNPAATTPPRYFPRADPRLSVRLQRPSGVCAIAGRPWIVVAARSVAVVVDVSADEDTQVIPGFPKLGTFFDAAATPSGARVLLVDRNPKDMNVVAYHRDTGDLFSRISRPGNWFPSRCCAMDEVKVVIALSSGRIEVWDIEQRALLLACPPRPDARSVYYLRALPAGVVMTVDVTSVVRLWGTKASSTFDMLVPGVAKPMALIPFLPVVVPEARQRDAVLVSLLKRLLPTCCS